MSVGRSVVLAVAAKVERTGGVRAGMVAWRALAANNVDAEVRAPALLAALRCATTLRDVPAIADIVSRWASVGEGLYDEAVVARAIALEEAHLLPQALVLAQAEARRSPTARALYLEARCRERIAGAEPPALAAAFAEVVARAEKEGAADIARASRTRRAVHLARSWTSLPDAIVEAQTVASAPDLPPETTLVVAPILLASPSRFVRASALGLLDEVVARTGGAPTARRALAVAARFVDEAGDAITPLEQDRLRAIFGRERARANAPRAAAVVDALERVRRAAPDDRAAALRAAAGLEPGLAEAASRARDIVAGRVEPNVTPERVARDEGELRHVRQQEILDVHAALRDRAPTRATRSLGRLAEAEEAGERLPREVIAAALAALRSGDRGLQVLATRFFRARLARVEASRACAPDEGWLAVANALAVSPEAADVAVVARHAAAAAREKGAVDIVGTLLAREAWEHARRGDARGALARLREAKATFARDGSARR